MDQDISKNEESQSLVLGEARSILDVAPEATSSSSTPKVHDRWLDDLGCILNAETPRCGEPENLAPDSLIDSSGTIYGVPNQVSCRIPSAELDY